ncbi:MAG TPA: hypothetical protein ENK43_06675 [Planctomycetes bacterium]|nr:hypothetical protein [Planctomycetota bacterium]
MKKNISPVLLALLSLLVVGCGGGGANSGDSGAQVMNTGLAVAANYPSGLTNLGDFVFTLVNELEQGATDLNGDGDAADDVVHMIDATTGQITNLGVAGTPLFAVNDTLVAWGVEEADEGLVDFNMDGDFGDTILVLFDPSLPVGPANPNITNISLEPVASIRGEGSIFVLVTSEVAANQDLNGDLVIDDFVLQLFDPATLTATGAGVAMNPDSLGYDLRHGIIVFEASEEDQTDPGGMGTDLNGDGDSSDDVLMGMSVATMTTFNIGPAGMARAVSPAGFRIIGTDAAPAVMYAIDEGDEGQNLNAGISNDTDMMDAVAAIFDVNTSTESLPAGGIAIQATRLSGSETRAVISASEADNGPTGSDYNVDGDTTDFVPFWVDLTLPNLANNVGVAQDDGSASSLPVVCGEFFVMTALETAQGPNGTNYNQGIGDTDTDDLVPFYVGMQTAATQAVNLGLAGDQVICGRNGDWVVLVADEADNSHDLNGDNDTADDAVFYFRVQGGTIAANGDFVRVGSGNISVQDCSTRLRFISFTMEGSDQGFGDMNQDGDFDDNVVITTQISKSSGGVIGTSVLGTVDNNVAMDGFPLLLNGHIVAFPTPEATIHLGINLNGASGDTDMFDSVLHLLILDCL